jgi:glutamine synthetase
MPSTAYIDPFFDETTVVMTCDVVDPADGRGYDRDPRSIAKRAEAYLKSSGIGDTAYFGPEPEFFIFDSVDWSVDMSGCSAEDLLAGSRLDFRREDRRRRRYRPPSRPSRAAISRCRRSTACTTSVRRWC